MRNLVAARRISSSYVQHEDVSMRSSSKRISFVAVAALAAAASLTSLAAAAEPRFPTRTVKAWDLDLDKHRDVQTLYERVRLAAADVCKHEAIDHWKSTRQAVPSGWRERCEANAVAAAVSTSGNRDLAALHAR